MVRRVHHRGARNAVRDRPSSRRLRNLPPARPGRPAAPTARCHAGRSEDLLHPRNLCPGQLDSDGPREIASRRAIPAPRDDGDRHLDGIHEPESASWHTRARASLLRGGSGHISRRRPSGTLCAKSRRWHRHVNNQRTIARARLGHAAATDFPLTSFGVLSGFISGLPLATGTSRTWLSAD
jgi:hypothetical protein